MPSCAVPTCKNAVGLKTNQDGVTFHVFPSDEDRKTKWMKIIQKTRLDGLWKPTKRSVICSIHFDEKHLYATKGGLKRLRKGAFPDKHMAIEVPKSIQWIDRSRNTNYLNSPPASEIRDVDISDSDSIFYTPINAKLKSQLRRTQILARKHVKLIKTLQQKNRRLAKRNEFLKRNLRNVKRSLYQFLRVQNKTETTSKPEV